MKLSIKTFDISNISYIRGFRNICRARPTNPTVTIKPKMLQHIMGKTFKEDELVTLTTVKTTDGVLCIR